LELFKLKIIMEKYFLFSLSILLNLSSFSQKQKITANTDGNCTEKKWELKFEDNFDGTSLDLNKWHFKYAPGTFSTEASNQYHSSENIKLENGICRIIPKAETVYKKAINWLPDTAIVDDGKVNLREYPYTSGCMDSNEQYLYGKFEIRCKIPKGKGLWPAFWMYGENSNKVNNEIDVFEFWNEETIFGKYNPKKLSMVHHMTVHYNKKMSGKKYIGVDFSLDFHTFTVVWDTTKIEWYVDGELKRIHTQYITKRGKNVECKDVKANNTYYLNPVFPKNPMNIIANLAIQIGKNKPDKNTFNTAFEIDYIRHFVEEK